MNIDEPIAMLTMPDEQGLDFQPKSFADYCGQQVLKEKLTLYAQAASARNEPLDHVLLFGPPGVGKTTLASIISKVMNVGMKVCSGPMLERTGDAVAILSSLEMHDILFIDEIHRLPMAVEEILYSAMEQFRVDIIIGQGAGAKSINLPLQPFTLIGATTKTGMISAPLRSRFGIIERIDLYTPEELQAIVLQNAQYLGIELDEKAALLIARSARGTPRIAKKIVRRVRDVAQIYNNNIADQQLVLRALTFLGIDAEGLSSVDHAIIQTIFEKFNGGPVGLETIASLVGEDSMTLEEVYEPYLMRLGYLEKTPRGRRIPYTMLPLIKKRFLGQESVF